MLVAEQEYNSIIPRDIREQVDKLLDKRNELIKHPRKNKTDLQVVDTLLKGFSTYYEHVKEQDPTVFQRDSPCNSLPEFEANEETSC